jgi:hypothetical protein
VDDPQRKGKLTTGAALEGFFSFFSTFALAAAAGGAVLVADLDAFAIFYDKGM